MPLSHCTAQAVVTGIVHIKSIISPLFSISALSKHPHSCWEKACWPEQAHDHSSEETQTCRHSQVVWEKQQQQHNPDYPATSRIAGGREEETMTLWAVWQWLTSYGYLFINPYDYLVLKLTSSLKAINPFDAQQLNWNLGSIVYRRSGVQTWLT